MNRRIKYAFKKLLKEGFPETVVIQEISKTCDRSIYHLKCILNKTLLPKNNREIELSEQLYLRLKPKCMDRLWYGVMG